MLSSSDSVRGFGGTALGGSGFASFESSHRALVWDRHRTLWMPFRDVTACEMRASGRAAKQLLSDELMLSAPLLLLRIELVVKSAQSTSNLEFSYAIGMAAAVVAAKWDCAGIHPAVRLPFRRQPTSRNQNFQSAHEPNPPAFPSSSPRCSVQVLLQPLADFFFFCL